MAIPINWGNMPDNGNEPLPTNNAGGGGFQPYPSIDVSGSNNSASIDWGKIAKSFIPGLNIAGVGRIDPNAAATTNSANDATDSEKPESMMDLFYEAFRLQEEANANAATTAWERNLQGVEEARAWQAMREDTYIQRLMKQAKDAGINPIYLVQQGLNGGETTTSAATAPTYSTSAPNTGAQISAGNVAGNMIGKLVSFIIQIIGMIA